MLTALFAQPPQEPMGFLANPYLPFYMIGMVFLFWFVLLRPVTARQKKEQADMLASVKRGAKILTSGGIVATVVTAKDGEDEIVVRSEESRFRLLRSAIVRVVGNDEAEAGK